MLKNLSSTAKITWCPGCPNSAILVSFRQAISELVDEGAFKKEQVVVAAGIGCHGKIADYLNTNSFNSLHGRLLPFMTGVKVADSNLQVYGFSGDGDSLGEGVAHLIHAARRNSDVNLFLHNNQLFALTTGQASPASPKDFKGKSTPEGGVEDPFNPLLLMLSSGATFVARSYAGDIKQTTRLMKEATKHKGFSYLEIIQPCITFSDTRDFFAERIKWLAEDHPKGDFSVALETARVADDGHTLLGVFYQTEKPTFENLLHAGNNPNA